MLLIILLSTVSAHLVSFQPERMRLIQVVNNNYMFRMGSPLTENLLNFNIIGIINTMKNILKYKNIKFPQNYQLVDTSLLNPKIKDDKYCLNIERNFIKSSNNSFLNYVFHGEKFSPKSIANITTRKYLASIFDEWSKDDLPKIIDSIELKMKNSYKTVIRIFHCMQGVDRTGEIIGAYEMKVFRKSLKDVIEEDSKINGGKLSPKKHNLNALLWYELFLKK